MAEVEPTMRGRACKVPGEAFMVSGVQMNTASGSAARMASAAFTRFIRPSRSSARRASAPRAARTERRDQKAKRLASTTAASAKESPAT